MGESGLAEGYMMGRDAGSGYNDGMFGGNGAWWIIILLIFLYGNRGWGNNGQNGSGVVDGYVLASDFANIERKIDSVNNGVCDGFYAMNTGMLNGFSNVQQTLCQGFGGVNQAINTSGFETRSAITNLGYNLQNCCCETQRAIDNVNYNMAKNTCDIRNTINSTTRDIIDAQRASTDSILGFLTNEKISSLQAQNAALAAQLSQNAQTSTIINTLRPVAQPAYITCSPYESVYGNHGCNGCGC